MKAKRLIAAPGRPRVDDRVRRNLGRGTSLLEGVSLRGECALEIDAIPSGRPYVVGFPGKVGYGDSPRELRIEWAYRVVVEGRNAGSEVPRPCDLYHDCRRIREGTQESSVCRDDWSEHRQSR